MVIRFLNVFLSFQDIYRRGRMFTLHDFSLQSPNLETFWLDQHMEDLLLSSLQLILVPPDLSAMLDFPYFVLLKVFLFLSLYFSQALKTRKSWPTMGGPAFLAGIHSSSFCTRWRILFDVAVPHFWLHLDLKWSPNLWSFWRPEIICGHWFNKSRNLVKNESKHFSCPNSSNQQALFQSIFYFFVLDHRQWWFTILAQR